jgi:hypothetical protein
MSPIPSPLARRSLAGLVLLSLSLASCSKAPARRVRDSQRTAFASAAGALSFTSEPPANPDALDSQLLRYRGQTRFLNAEATYKMWRAARGAGGDLPLAEAAPAPSDKRAEQESDIYKLGPKGSQLLYLLNNYRGLQVVSFAKGAAQAEIIGRALPTGRTADAMYLLENPARILVLESPRWSGRDEERKGRLLVYDVSDARAPKLAESLPIEGQVADSRLVGEVLYVASYVSGTGDDKGRGLVHSFRVTGARVKSVDEQTLRLPVGGRENMNILESVDAAGKTHYYLAAVLSEWPGGFWDRASAVELVDISDPRGQIAPLMVVNARGQIRERTQTLLRDNTLIVTSQFTPESAGTTGRARIAVETFTLPKPDSEVLHEDEAEYRQKHIERLVNKTPEDDRNEKRVALLNDAELGLRGRFVRTPEGSLRKLVADTIVTVGDTRGQHASLQDVRVSGDRLYVFWVPTDLVDPFDLFDISKPSEGVRHLQRLEFDGWVERAIPFAAQGRQFVLGLGYVVPAVNNDRNRRYPQSVLFEIKEENNETHLVEVSHLTLSQKNLWANFNDADRMIDVRFTGEGQGEVLFRLSDSSHGRYRQGGKLVRFDALKPAVSEGAFLAGEADWLRRVFRNPDLPAIQTFSDSWLGTFASANGATGEFEETAHLLELARDVRGYATLTSPTGNAGVQILARDARGDEAPASTVLRRVNLDTPDAEAPQAAAELTLEGRYVTHFVRADGREALVYTARLLPKLAGSTHSEVAPHPDDVSQKEHLVVQRIRLAGTGFESVEAQNATDKPLPQGSWYLSSDVAPRELPSGLVVANFGGRLVVTDAASALRVRSFELEGLLPASLAESARQSLSVFELGGTLYAKYTEEVESPSDTVRYLRHFIAPIELSFDSVKLGAAVNVPGEALLLTAEGHLVTSDETPVEVHHETTKDGDGNPVTTTTVRTKKGFASLQLADGLAHLQDLEQDDRGYGESAVRVDSRLAFIEGSENDGPGVLPMFEMSFRRPLPRPSAGPRELVLLGVDSEGRFVRESRALGGELANGARLVGTQALGEPGAHLLFVRGDDEFQIVRLAKDTEPKLLALENKAVAAGPVTEPATTEATRHVPFLGWEDRFTVSAQRHSVMAASSSWGVQEILWKD